MYAYSRKNPKQNDELEKEHNMSHLFIIKGDYIEY